MNFTLHQLQIFGMVARHKSMTEAARQLHMSQPAVSIQIKQLQESVGIPLIEIVGRRLYLTNAGERLYEVYKSITQELESFDSAVSQFQGGLKGTLSISAASTAKYFVPYLLGEFQRRYPLVEIKLKVTNRNEVLHHLSQNEFDLAVLTQLPEDESIEAKPFFDNPLVMAAPPDHPLAYREHIALEELAKQTFIYRELGSGTRMVMEQYLRDKGINVKPAMELGTNEAVKQAIMAGIGISVISRLSMGNELSLNQISILSIDDFPILTRWHVLYNKKKKLTPVTQNFLSFLQEKDIQQYTP
ncbi:LysR family transcriptional regulator [Halalkalibaculum sp. DA3122]|uniref:LysR family transcriptional regulator n=1 Tax=unclassified Halalkalibaculum TaxID=2964617 RepID=UPI003754DFB3